MATKKEEGGDPPAKGGGTTPKRGVKRKRMFARELPPMMYGFGDVHNPLPESVELLEDMVMEYITEMTQKAMQVASKRGKLQTEDVVFLIRKDPKKYARAMELLRMNDEIKKARKGLEPNLMSGHI